MYLINQFKQDALSRWSCGQPSDGGLPLALDRRNTIEPAPNQWYLVQEVNLLPGRIRFVEIVKSADEIFRELEPLLAAAKWQRPEHVTGEPHVKVLHREYGEVEAFFYRSTGRYARDFVEVRFTYVGAKLRFTLEAGTASLDSVAAQVKKTVGPAINLAAAISRQSEGRRNPYGR